MTNLTWHVQRLRKMPLQEIPYRCLQSLRKAQDKYLLSRPSGVSGGEAEIRLPGVAFDADAIGPDFAAQLAACAAEIRQHRFRVFGLPVASGPAINWHLDPKTGRQWPLGFWGDIDYRDGTRIGGIKFAWELNRLYHLPILALAYRHVGDRASRQEMFEQLASWLAGNPYPRGINWISGIELAIRLVNLVYSLMCIGLDGLTDRERRMVLDFASLHGHHLYRYPSRHSSCANHAVAEGFGLYVAGSSFPALPGAAAWKHRGRSILEEQIPRQIQADGGGCESSVPYLLFVAEHALLYFLWSRHYGDAPGEAVVARLCAALELLSRVIDSGGNFPLIGDGDDGCVLRPLHGPQDNPLFLLNAGAILFHRPQWLTPCASYDFKTCCLLGAPRARWQELKRSAPGRGFTVRRFADSGLVAVEDPTRQVLLVVNGTPLGLPPLAGHGHADALSFWLSVGGRPMLVDPGTFLYHDGGPWRCYFRGTAAHNTVRVDGQDQAPILSDFMFGRFYQVREVQVRRTGGEFSWSASHDGYCRLADPVVHRRVLAYCPPEGRLTVVDILRCRAGHTVESFFHFHPDCRVSARAGGVVARSGAVELMLHPDPQWESCRVVRGQTEPIAGWYSPAFNDRQASCTLICRRNIARTAVFRTTIILSSIRGGQEDL